MGMGIAGILWSAPMADAIAMAVTAVVVRVWKNMGADELPAGQQSGAVLQVSRPGVIIAIAREHGSASKRIEKHVFFVYCGANFGRDSLVFCGLLW